MPGKKRTPVTGGKVHGVRDMKALPRTQNLGAPAEAIGSPYETPAPKHNRGQRLEICCRSTCIRGGAEDGYPITPSSTWPHQGRRSRR